MDLEIKNKYGNTYRMSDFGVVYDFVVGSIQMESYTDRVEGRIGLVDYGADYVSRQITVPMKFRFREMQEYAHKRDELYGILTDTDGYYIRELRRPRRLEYEFVDFGKPTKWKKQTDNQYVNGKQYFVRLVDEIEPEQLYNGGEIELTFETIRLPFAETIYTSQDLNGTTKYAAAAAKFGLVDNINQTMLKYSFTDTQFDLWNAGTADVDPYSMQLKITFKNVTTSGNFTVENWTTGDVFEYRDAVSGKDIVLNGPHVTIGGTNQLRSTNREFISLRTGTNTFRIRNGTCSEVQFDFPFYYK